MNIQKLVQEALNKKQEDRKLRTRSGLWSPSSFGQCFRRQYWNRKNEPPTNPPDDRTLRVFMCGEIFHDFIKQYVEAPKEVEVRTEDTLGYADIVLGDEIIEIKSQNSRAWFHMAKEAEKGKSISESKPEHVLQGSFYAINLDKPFLHLVYIDKDTLCMSEYRLAMTPQNRANLALELATLNDFWKNGEIPPASPRLYSGAKECEYCQFKDKCFTLEGKSGKSDKP